MTLLLIVKIGIAAGGGPSTPRIMSKSGKTNGSRALGPLGVGSGIANRHGGSTAPVASIVLASKQFSCWDGEAVRLASTGPLGLAGPLRAAYSALFGLVPDPTGGATDDLNVPLTLQTHADHRPPAWAADPADATQSGQGDGRDRPPHRPPRGRLMRGGPWHAPLQAPRPPPVPISSGAPLPLSHDSWAGLGLAFLVGLVTMGATVLVAQSYGWWP